MSEKETDTPEVSRTAEAKRMCPSSCTDRSDHVTSNCDMVEGHPGSHYDKATGAEWTDNLTRTSEARETPGILEFSKQVCPITEDYVNNYEMWHCPDCERKYGPRPPRSNEAENDARDALEGLVQFIRGDQCDKPCWCCHDYLSMADAAAAKVGLPDGLACRSCDGDGTVGHTPVQCHRCKGAGYFLVNPPDPRADNPCHRAAEVLRKHAAELEKADELSLRERAEAFLEAADMVEVQK